MIAEKQCPGIEVLHVSKDEIEQAKPKLLQDFEGVRAIPDVKKKHTIITIGSYCIDVKDHSGASTTARHVFKVVGDDDITADDVDEIELVPLMGTDMELDTAEEEKSDTADEDGRDDEAEAEEGDSGGHDAEYAGDGVDVVHVVDVGNWVKVQYSQQKDARKFVGQVIRKSGEDIVIKFLKKIPAFDKYVWPEIEEIDTVQSVNIVDILPEPQMDR